MTRICHTSLFLFYCLLIFCRSSTAQQSVVNKHVSNTAIDFSPVEKKIRGWVDSGYYNGASIIIAKDNNIIYEQYFGNYDTNTVAYIASAGKWLAAATIAAVVGEGKLSWNDKVKKWLPQFKDVKGEATLRQLFSHTAGYPDYQPKGTRADNYQTLEESVAHIVDLPADILPGTRFKYGGLAMQVAGRMAELATGKDWETLFQEKIAKPLEMKLTHFTPVDETPGHNPMLGGGARASLRDYANFLQMISNKGVFNGKRVLSAQAIREMQADQVGHTKVPKGEYVEYVRATNRKDIYGLGEWREEVNEKGEVVLISSPGWAGAYPWIDKTTGVYGFFLTRISNFKPGFNSFYASPVLPMMVRDVLKNYQDLSTANNLDGKSFHQANEAEWQWSVEVKSAVSNETHDHPRAFLWIPPDCKQVRGVVVGQHNMTEEGILEHPHFRKVMTELGFAEVWVSPGINVIFDFNNGAGEQFNEMMKALANESGYSELAFAPVVPIGHSALASYPWNFAAWNPGRTLAILSIHGDAPLTNLTGSGHPNPDWGNRNINGIPGLMVIGEYEWMEERVSPAMKFRSNYPNAPVSLLADAGYGHFDYSDALVSYLAMFIKKAAKYRLPSKAPLDKPVELKPVNPQEGWLMDKWRKDEPLKASAARYADYLGDKSEAFWYYDKEIAKATEQYYTSSRGKLPQYLRFEQEGKLVPYTGGHSQYRPLFIPLEDGISFRITPVFSDTIFRNGEKPMLCTTGHANGDPVISRICGPVVQTGPYTFRLQFYRMGMNNPKRSNDIWLLASHPGDKRYKSVVQQSNIRFPLKNSEGAEQKITFPALSDQKEGVKALQLNATSNSGMQVYYYVQEGPAELEGSTLRFTKIPSRSRFPVKVTVVAWQYGRTVEPKVQSAQPVVQSFYLTK